MLTEVFAVVLDSCSGRLTRISGLKWIAVHCTETCLSPSDLQSAVKSAEKGTC
jgi:hypothetical protein